MRRNAIFAALGLPLLLTAAAALGEKQKSIETLTAFAASLGTGRSGAIDIDIYRWSTDEERESLLTTLQEFGPDKAVDALAKIRPPVGILRSPGHLGYDLYYARNIANPDGSRRIILATNRPVNFREATNSARSLQYQFTLIEIHLDANGKGEGKLVPAARVTWDKSAKRLEIENYDALPVELLNVVSKPS